jgi:hypothetical protein
VCDWEAWTTLNSYGYPGSFQPPDEQSAGINDPGYNIGLSAEAEFRLAKMRTVLRGEAQTERPEHRETARDSPGCAITGDGSCKAIAETMIVCHASNLHHPIGHLLSDRQKNRKIIQTCRSRKNFTTAST